MHARVLSYLDPALNVPPDQELLLVHAVQGLLLVLIVDVAHYFQQARLGDLVGIGHPERLLRPHVLIQLL